MLAWTPPPRFSNTAHSAPSLSPSAAGIMYVAARIPLAGLASQRVGAVHLTPPEWADAADSGGISFGAAAQAERIAKIERETIEMQMKTRALFKFVLLLLTFRFAGRGLMLTQVPDPCTVENHPQSHTKGRKDEINP